MATQIKVKMEIRCDVCGNHTADMILDQDAVQVFQFLTSQPEVVCAGCEHGDIDVTIVNKKPAPKPRAKSPVKKSPTKKTAKK